MPSPKFSLLILLAGFYCSMVPAQVRIPAFTGYAVPAEPEGDDNVQGLFSEKDGLHHWTDTRQQLQYFFKAAGTGELTVSLLVKNSWPGTKLQVTIAGEKFVVNVPLRNEFKKIIAGTVTITTPGFYVINIAALTTPVAGRPIASLLAIELQGEATAGIQFNSKPRRNAASVHLRYDIPDSTKAVSFYNELTIPAGSDPVYSYYMACGFARGYFGIQVNSATERRVIFSVWDAGKEAADRNKVLDDDKVKLKGKGAGVVASDFGNEGTGGHSHLVYNWKAGETYKFLVTALPDSASTTTTYTGYFFMPDIQKWKLIAAFSAPKDGKYLNHLYSFVENFVGVNGQLQRKALLGNQWIKTESGQWTGLTTASFSYDATGKAGDRTDYGAGIENGQFYLWNGGFRRAGATYQEVFSRQGVMQNPVIDLYSNADSVAQAAADSQAILATVAGGDSLSLKNGLYYEILKQGAGRPVAVTDTVVAYYKGALLNGEVFDETKDKPATFPFNRLIKGWQLGLPLCRVGGKIKLIIPSGLAYSIRTRSPKIPPNSVLVFEIEIVDAKKAVSF